MKKPQQIPNPFKSADYVPGAPVLSGKAQQPQMLAAVAEHVIGHRITKITFTREIDRQASAESGKPVDNIDLTICLDNNVAYCARFVLSSLATVSRGEALAHIPADDADYVQPK